MKAAGGSLLVASAALNVAREDENDGPRSGAEPGRRSVFFRDDFDRAGDGWGDEWTNVRYAGAWSVADGAGVIELPPSTPKAVGEKGKVVAAYMARPVLVGAHEVGDVEVQANVSIEEGAEAGLLARAGFDQGYALLLSGDELLLCRYGTADRQILGSEPLRRSDSYRLTLTVEKGRVIGLAEPRGSGRATSIEAFDEDPIASGRVGAVLNPTTPDATSARFRGFRAASTAAASDWTPRLVYAFAGADYADGTYLPLVTGLFDPPSAAVVELRRTNTDEEPFRTRVEPDSGPLGNCSTVLGRGPLEPGESYEWSFTAEGTDVQARGVLRVPPAAGDAARFVFASCTSGRVTEYPSFRTVAGLDPDFYLHGGDWGYADLTAVNTGPDQFQARWIRLLRHPDVTPLLEKAPLMFWQDDHDYNADNGWADEIDPAAVTAFDEIHANPSDDYFDVRWGDVHVWCLDCRLHATDPKAPDGPDKSRIGAEQKAWLKNGMTESDAPVKVVASGMVFRNKPPEDPGWHNDYAHERDELLGFFASLDDTVVILSGDSHGQRLIHHFEFGELYEFNSSGTDFPGGGQGNHDPEHTLINNESTPGFAFVELDETGPNRKLKVSCLSSEDGHELFSKTFPVG
jgi:hypothetical protein